MRKAKKRLDYLIFFSFIILVFGVGLAALTSASSDLGKSSEFNDPYHFLKDQLLWGVGVGSLGFMAGYLINYRIYKKLSPIILIGSVVLLLLLFTPLGASSGGAQRWLLIGLFAIQPSELLKLTMVLFFAAWLSKPHSTREQSIPDGLIPFLSILGFISLILLFQNSTSAAFIIGVTILILYFASGARLSFILAIVLISMTIFASFIVATPYRYERIKSFMNPTEDIQGSAYQINQALTVIGSGGWTGVGYGGSNAKKFLPERMGDSIFAIIAEEVGFIGAMMVIFVYLLLIIGGFIASRHVRDKFGKLILVGLSAVIGTQTFVHIASASALIPTTGVPLPFVSYGNFSLVVFMTMVGIMLNVHKNA
ncbi:MAG: stage V sporulation protein E [Candidatus Colwellbacteria bacterium CG10_big_fil_rev_8_21_14_0_10_42_22]|uniref:Probable peptidoglycan glycosyltransferase FtsW n=1 Tax=Candidatus Colwellbacteria bacterium CG10_big_fil_rev_8_21_14_0_10_42_22 TaxID=1974540 RepID=A0A2H0VFE8_9BACT|nr:MAG: stage V sporulation protein E [Candidatus Colwellbacteria bacterium CG10_big_fil_rev_8_21_14_0_10_42_22]